MALKNRKLALVILFVLGLAVRLVRLDAALWYDEAFSATLAQLPLPALVTASLGDVHPPAYYLLLWLIGGVFGYSEAVLRIPSVLAGVALIGVIYRLAQKLALNEPAVWLAAALTAFAPFQVYYSQEARFYAIQMLAIVLAALGLVERRWWLLVAGSLAALYLHNVSAFFVAALFVAGIGYTRLKPLFLSGVVVALGFIPGALMAQRQAQAVGAAFWVLPVSSPGRILDMFNDLIFYTPRNPFTITCCLITSICLLLICLNWTKSHRLPLIMTFLPVVMVVTISLAWRPIFISRIMAPVAPFFYLLLAGAVVVSRRRLFAFAPLVIISVVILAGSMMGEIGRQETDWAELGFYNQYRQTDGIYHAGVGSYVIWNYYLPERDHYLLKQENDLSSALTTTTKNAMNIKQANFDDIKNNHPRWWFVSHFTGVSPQVEIDTAENLIKKGRWVATFRKDIISDSELFLIETTIW